MKICFFVRVKDKNLFQIVEFYRNDIDILKSMGLEVHCINNIFDLLFRRYDGYYVWWFGYGIFPIMISKILGVPSIVTGNIHTIDGGGLSKWIWPKRFLMKCTMKSASISLFTSITEYDRLDGFQVKNSKIVYHAINKSRYFFDESISREKVILTISHLTKENVIRKKILDAIEAFSEFYKTNPDYTYIICGKMDDGTECIRNRILELNMEKHITLAGQISDLEKISMLQSSKAYLQPTQCEGFGLALLEAQSCGTPVITSPDPCIVEVYGDSVLYGSNTQGLALSLTRLVSSEILYTRMQNLSLSNADKYSIKARYDSLHEIISKWQT
jgi:glycosyltransferase involved in cell wall biosynthesis